MLRISLVLLWLLAGCSQDAPDPEATTAPEAVASSPVYDTTPPAISQWMPRPAILVFSKTLGWRHDEGISGADLFFVRLARERGYGIFTTENAAVFTPDLLARFDVIIFNNVTGNVLSPPQEQAFQDWLLEGGAWIGLHSSGDNSTMDWEWYRQRLIGPGFVNHPADPQFQDATLEVLAPAHPVATGLPARWVQNDEWYTFTAPASDLGFVAVVGVDESTYAPFNDQYGEGPDLRMGEGAASHPLVWAGCPGEGRSVYSALGHLDLVYDVPEYQQLLRNAFDWVTKATDLDSAHCPP